MPARRSSDLAASGGDALLVGTGLTMVDLVLSLDAAGYRGRDRRAVPPRPDSARPTRTSSRRRSSASEVPQASCAAMWRWLRQRSAEVGWRAAIDSLRPHSQSLWQSLDRDEQQRFLRHARPWWDVHRHRIAPEVAATVARLVAEGRLEIDGRPDHLGAEQTATGFEVELAPARAPTRPGR